MPSPFQVWPSFWNLLQRWHANPTAWGLNRHFVENFQLEDHALNEMLTTYKGSVAKYVTPHVNATSDNDLKRALRDWIAGHQEYWKRWIRQPSSLSFKSNIGPTRLGDPCNVLGATCDNHWLVQLRRLDNIFEDNLDRSLRSGRVRDTDGELRKICEMKINFSKIKEAFDKFEEDTATHENFDFSTYLDALNKFYKSQHRIGQPVHVGLAKDCAECFEEGSLLPSSPHPRVKPQYQETIGTIIRDKLAISSFEKDQSVLLLCYKVSDLRGELASDPHLQVLARPTVLDVGVNSWFCPSSRRYGICGQTVNVAYKQTYNSCCELIHPQYPAYVNECVWLGRITDDWPAGDPSEFRRRHLDYRDMNTCQRTLDFCTPRIDD